MRVSRLLIDQFRGWQRLDLCTAGHALLAGVPRAGRSDIIAALTRVLAPDSARTAPALSDLWQTVRAYSLAAPRDGVPGDADPSPEPIDAAGGGTTANSARGQEADASGERRLIVDRAIYAEIEVTLVDFDPDLQQLFDGYLEPLGADGTASDEHDADPNAPWCVRLTCRLSYDAEADTLEQVLYYPARSNPAIGQFTRVPAATRRALPVVVLSGGRPLQLRAGAALRHVLDERDPTAAADAFDALCGSVTTAASTLSANAAIADAVDAVLATSGAGARLGDTTVTASQVGFHADDGSLEALLRALQPALHLDGAGPLLLPNHGSTATALLSAAEALMLATVPGAVVLADDFGDHLDAAAAEHLAAVLRAGAGQLWLSTRRPEAARAFEPDELIRLARHGGVRSHHTLTKSTDRKALKAMRQLHTQLLAALTAPTVAITEGPHDVAVYSAVDRRRPPSALPLSAFGVRLVAAGTGEDGGITKIPLIANLAHQLGFRVVALIDRDKPSPQTDAEVAAVEKSCDVVIRLPEKTAIDRAIIAGIASGKIRAASATLTAYDIPDPVDGKADADIATALGKAVHKHGLHEQLLTALYDETGTHPPMIVTVLDAVAQAADPNYAGPTTIDIPAMPAMTTTVPPTP